MFQLSGFFYDALLAIENKITIHGLLNFANMTSETMAARDAAANFRQKIAHVFVVTYAVAVTLYINIANDFGRSVHCKCLNNFFGAC